MKSHRQEIPAAKKAVVVGALGVIGRYIVERLLAEGDWQVVGLSRRAAKNAPRYSRGSGDLLDLKDVRKKLGGMSDVTHSIYAAFQPVAGAAADYTPVVAPNRDIP